VREFEIDAWAARDLMPGLGGKVVYNTGYDPDGYDPTGTGVGGSPTGELITDPSGLFYVLTAESPAPNAPAAATTDIADLQAGTKRPEPLVLRARAGECIKVTLTNQLADDGSDWPDHPGDAEFPRIFGRTETGGLNADSFRPSKQVSIHATVVTTNVNDSVGANVGFNQAVGPLQTAGPQQTVNYTWYAGNYEVAAVVGYPNIKTIQHQPIPFGAVNLSSAADLLKQVPQGLVGMLVLEPEDADWIVDPYGKNTRTVAEVTHNGGAGMFEEFVVVYQDGLNLLYGPGNAPGGATQNIPNCHICDDSYDRGEQAWNYLSDPFWARLGSNLIDPGTGLPATNPLGCVGEGGAAPCDTLDSVYPKDFFLSSWKPIEVPKFDASPGQDVQIRVGNPGGLARQDSFTVGGHNYLDYGLPGFGTHGTSLSAPGKSFTADLVGGAREGLWIVRPGPQYKWSHGMWAQLNVADAPPPTPPLSVSISSPANGSFLNATTVPVSGNVSDNTATVDVNKGEASETPTTAVHNHWGY
jgi:hypothetical protein